MTASYRRPRRISRVHVAHGGSRRRAGHRGRAGVGKEVEHPDGPPGGTDALHGEIPVGRLLRKDAGVLEVHRLDVEGQPLVTQCPALGQFLLDPLAPSGGGALVPGVVPPPSGMPPLRTPDGLRIGPHQQILAPALQTLAAAAVQQLIVLPVT